VTFELVKADRRRKGILADWERWLREADRLYYRHLDELEYSPFEYHEVAAVGFLAAAAARSDFLTLNEYEIVKRSQSDKRCKVPGRADLWMRLGDRTYSFEFKRASFAATAKNLEATLKAARSDIEVIDKDECHFAAGVSLAYVRDKARISKYRAFADHALVDAAYRIGPDGPRGAYIFFTIKANTPMTAVRRSKG
jgi:hypothetical protein